MDYKKRVQIFKSLLTIFLLGGCQAANLTSFKQGPISFSKLDLFSPKMADAKDSIPNNSENKTLLSLSELLESSIAEGVDGSNFVAVMKSALEKDPIIIASKRKADAKRLLVASAEARKDFVVSTTVYGGIEDISDESAGLALALSAQKPIYDGGLLDYEIDSRRYLAESSVQVVRATIDQRALILGERWIELEKYERLQKIINDRLAVLDPLIIQLEQVAKAGIGDVSKVTAAQRTVSGIRVAETNVAEGLAQAKVEFINAFGSLPRDVNYDHNLIAALLPKKVNNLMIQKSPVLVSHYSTYKSVVSEVLALRAKDTFAVGFEALIRTPVSGNDSDSDESLGFTARKTIYNGGMLESDIKEAESRAEAALADVQVAFREAQRTINTAQQNIISMEKAIRLAKENAELTVDEIVYLKRQLIIGGSTLDSVLSAEARLYEAEAREIEFWADKNKSQLNIAASLGLLTPALGM